MASVLRMELVLTESHLPLVRASDGSVRFQGSRVTLDSVLHAFQQGATAEEIVLRFPTLQLADVYSAIGFYLRARDDVDAYLAARERLRDEVRGQAESRPDAEKLRDRLLARRTSATS